MLNGRLSVTEVAKELRVSTKTITRREKVGKVRPAKRDWRGRRIYSREDIEEMRDFVQALY